MTILHPDIEKILFSEDEIAARVKQMGQQISQDYRELVDEKQPLIVVGILRGASIFFADIVRKIDVPLEFDFISMSSYGNSSTSSGQLTFIKDLEVNIRNRHLLIIEDIIDSGFSMNALEKILKERGATSIKLCALISKPSRRVVEVPIDYCGFDSPDEFLVGFGLDYAQRYRNLPFVGVLKKSVYS